MADERNEIKKEVNDDEQEFGTSGSLDGQQRLVVKGRFKPTHFEGMLRLYVGEYVICFDCKSADTLLYRENRLFFVRCEKCGSRICPAN